ncbi:hypothetical protein EYF80_054884 [Liparis tanakae]|uniref:Uncharacterized protein n=1 Tax=Liparis tanakae TaxID=230148 RepID=A0A4Z2F1N0_9TELE|nr:hypothetical protein EYF80_054884 [Liparis tanakae]
MKEGIDRWSHAASLYSTLIHNVSLVIENMISSERKTTPLKFKKEDHTPQVQTGGRPHPSSLKRKTTPLKFRQEEDHTP